MATSLASALRMPCRARRAASDLRSQFSASSSISRLRSAMRDRDCAIARSARSSRTAPHEVCSPIRGHRSQPHTHWPWESRRAVAALALNGMLQPWREGAIFGAIARSVNSPRAAATAAHHASEKLEIQESRVMIQVAKAEAAPLAIVLRDRVTTRPQK